MTFIRHHFNNLKLAHKFALLFTFAIMLTGLTGIGIVNYVTEKYNQELYIKTSLNMDYLVSNIETGLKDVENITWYLAENPQIQESLTIYSESTDTQERARNKRLLYDSLYSYYNSDSNIISIILLLPDGSFIRMGYSSQDFESPAFESLEKLSDKADGRLIWQGGNSYLNSAVCARQIRQKAYLKLNKLATLFVEVDMEKIILNSMGKSDPLSLILETDESRIYYPHPFPESMEAISVHSASGYEIIRSQDSTFFATFGMLPYTSWRYIHFSDYDELFSHLRTAIKTALLTLLLTTLIVVAAEYAIIGRITSHFRNLEIKMNHFESGSMELIHVPYNYSERKDEIGELHRRFDQMVLNNKKLVHDNYLQQILLKDATIKNLEQQINPHFLYNVLDTIYLMAEAHEVPDIADMSHALAVLFRASISENKPTISLCQELEYLNSYIHIQRIRFRNQVHFTSRCDKECMNIMIPKLSIQPLVENALKHGIEDTGDTCDIILSVCKEKGGTCISVANTGSRFDENMEQKLLQPLLSADDSLSIHGIGLRNINERLQLIYGPECRLKFTNTQSHAVVCFVIPEITESGCGMKERSV